MKVDKSQTKLIFEFTPAEFFLCRAENDTGWPYYLNYRISRSEKGKDDDVGTPVIFLSSEQAQTARENGFSEVL